MKQIISTIILASITFVTNAQDVLYNNGSVLQVNTGCVIQVNGDFTNTAASTLTNNGTLTVMGNSTNNQAMSVANAGTLEFKGTTAQSLNGTSVYFAKNVTVNNVAGVTINTPLKVDGFFTFTNGIVNATTTANAVTFTSNATVSGAADASHINGYVVKEGTGNFTYPVGDGTKYQQCDVNLTANATGMQVKYNASDAGAGAFTTSGTEATALIAYNKLEHWDITPLSTATGTVTMYWDANKNVGIVNVSDLKVAHKVGANWLNEGTTGTGSVGAGSITSNIISTWSPFTLGSVVNSTLPLLWLNVSGSVNAQKQAVINFKVNENNVANYVIEKKTDNNNWTPISRIASRSNGDNTYQFTDVATLQGTTYYRIKQQDLNGASTYSSIVKLSNYQIGSLSIYPNPVKDVVTISGAKVGSIVMITDVNGKVLQQQKITHTTFTIDMSKYNTGTYFLKTTNGPAQKIVKQ
jgi:hypothetical protein